MNGTDLLTEFRERRSEDAFRQLVLRYTNLVYAVAKRRVSNASLAEEITQIVFIRLAKAAPKLPGDAELAAWLHRTTVHASIDLWRSEIRRRNRENYAVAMQTDPNETVPWNDLAPVLDDAVNELSDTDRQAIVLRFFADKSMRDVGANLGVSEDAAKMRVSRALDRLRHLVGARGVSCGAIAFGTLLAQHSIEAAPAHVAANLAVLKIPAPATLSLTSGVLIGVATLVLVGAGFLFLRPQNPATPPPVSAAAAHADTATPQTNNEEPADTVTASGDPNPLQLLQAVARARERITSGIVEFYAFSENTHWGPRATNHRRFSATFDGPKLRFESFHREYSFVGVGKEGEASAAKMKELGLDNEAAVQAGLLTPFESHHVIVRDGAVVMDYWENDGESVGTTIKDPTNDTASLHFDPRMLGITSWLRTGSIEPYLGYPEAKSIKLMGKELVEGNLAWHIHVQSKYDASLHYWLEVDHPTRVLKHADRSDVVLSKYHGRSPIPTEVIIKGPKSGWRILQTNAHFNVTVDPASFTLAGLGMQVRTAVSDNRISRRIGYWTGTGLSEQWPPEKAKIAESPKLGELMALLEQNPTSHFALQAAIWILLNTPDGPEVEKAAEVVIQEHIESPELLHLAKEQERVRHRSSKKLLQALLDNNPSPEIKAVACFTLATLLKDEAKHGLNKPATAQADKLFDRFIREFPKSNQRRNAQRALHELRHLTIGNPAPEMAGVDLYGNPMKLSDHRGKVVLLYFWSSYYDYPDDHHKLVAAMAGKPFALIGFNSHYKLDPARQAAEKHGLTWPSFYDGQHGPIYSHWNLIQWPSSILLDQNGIIRHYNLRWFHELEKAANSLLP